MKALVSIACTAVVAAGVGYFQGFVEGQRWSLNDPKSNFRRWSETARRMAPTPQRPSVSQGKERELVSLRADGIYGQPSD